MPWMTAIVSDARLAASGVGVGRQHAGIDVGLHLRPKRLSHMYGQAASR